MSNESDIDIDEVVNQHKDDTGDGRAGTEPETTDADTPSLEDAVADAYRKIDDEEDSANEHIATRDRNLSALFSGLDDSGQLADLGEQAAAELDREMTSETQADLLRLLVRYAIDDLESDILESGKAGLQAYERAKAEQAGEGDF